MANILLPVFARYKKVGAFLLQQSKWNAGNFSSVGLGKGFFQSEAGYIGGWWQRIGYKIEGTITKQSSPISRRVFLMERTSKLIVATAMSSETDGSYAFYHLNPERRFIVFVFDKFNDCNIVIQDNVTPVAM